MSPALGFFACRNSRLTGFFRPPSLSRSILIWVSSYPISHDRSHSCMSCSATFQIDGRLYNLSLRCFSCVCALHRRMLFPLQLPLVSSLIASPLLIPAWRRCSRSLLPPACSLSFVSSRQLRQPRPPHARMLDLRAAGPRHLCPLSPGHLMPSLLQARAAPAPPAYLNHLAPPDWIVLWSSQLKAACSLMHMSRGAPSAASPPRPTPAAGLLVCGAPN